MSRVASCPGRRRSERRLSARAGNLGIHGRVSFEIRRRARARWVRQPRDSDRAIRITRGAASPALRCGMERPERLDPEQNEDNQHDHLGNEERRLGLCRCKSLQRTALSESLCDRNEDVEVQREQRARSRRSAPERRRVDSVERDRCAARTTSDMLADNMRGRIDRRERETGNARQYRRGEKDRRPACEDASSRTSPLSRRASRDPDQAYDNVKYRKRRRRHSQDHDLPPS